MNLVTSVANKTFLQKHHMIVNHIFDITSTNSITIDNNASYVWKVENSCICVQFALKKIALLIIKRDAIKNKQNSKKVHP